MSKTRDERRETREKQLLKSSNSACHCEERSDAAIQNDFKMTEVGMIPWDWNVLSIGQIANVLTGFPFPGNTILENGKTRLLRGINITEGLIRHSEDIDRYYSGNEESLKDYALRENDLVIGMDGSKVGKNSAIIDKNHSGDLLVQRVARLRMKNSLQPVSYVFYFVASDFFIAYIDSIKTSSAIPHISPLDIRSFRIPLPPTIEEQQRIANALSDVDSLISNLEKLIAKKKNIKQGAMQQLLTGRKRLPGFGPSCHPERSTKCAVEGSSHFKMTELGPIPSDWEVKKLKDCVSSFIVPMRDKPELLNGPIPWCRIEDFDGTYLYGSKSNQGVHMDTVRKMNLKIYPVGTLIVSCSAYLGKCAIVGKELITNQTFIGLVPMKETNVSFLYYRMSSEEKRLNDMATGTTITYLSREQFENFEVIFPSSKAEQTAIANVLSDMDSEIQTLETKLAKYRKLKTSMMQQLLTGKIRLI